MQTLNKIFNSKPLFVIVLGLLCWFGMNAIIDFSNMPVLVSRNLHHYFIYRHTLSLFIGLVAFLFALRYGVHFNKYYLYFLGLGGLLALLPFYNGPHHIKAFRRWFECGELLIRVSPAILLFMLPVFCHICDCIEKKIYFRRNLIFLISILILSNICFLSLSDGPMLVLSDIIFIIIILSCKIHLFIKTGTVVSVIMIGLFATKSELFRMIQRILTLLEFNTENCTRLFETFWYSMMYQTDLAYRDIFSGGLFGSGLGYYSTIHVWTYPLPTISSFVFQIIGREYGVAGIFFIIFLYSYLFTFLFLICKNYIDGFSKKVLYALLLFILLPTLIGFINTFNFISYFPSYQIPFLGYGPDGLILYFLAIGTALGLSNPKRF